MPTDPAQFKKVPKGRGTDGQGGIAGLRKRLRDTERLLKRPNLQATAKQDLERRVKALKLEISLKARESVETDMVQKYKYVKHVERTKVLRKIGKLEKAFSEGDVDDSERASINEELALQRRYLAYIEFFPRDMKYVSLFPKEEATPADEPAKGGKKKRKVAGTEVTAEEVRMAVMECVSKGIKNRDAEKAGFTLRLADVFDEDKQEVYLAQTRLLKKVKASDVTVAKSQHADAGKEEGAPSTVKKATPKKAATKPKSMEVSREHDEDGDDFFLTGDDSGGEALPASLEEINPEDFVVERAVKEKKAKSKERKEFTKGKSSFKKIK